MFIFSALDYYVHKILYKDMTNFGIIPHFVIFFLFFYKKGIRHPKKDAEQTYYIYVIRMEDVPPLPWASDHELQQQSVFLPLRTLA